MSYFKLHLGDTRISLLYLFSANDFLIDKVVQRGIKATEASIGIVAGTGKNI